MCTLSWRATANGYELLFNRDEAQSRQPAMAPTRRQIDGVEVLAPTDGDFGGTWISLNAFGTCISILNRYQDSAVGPGPFTSRGQLVLDLATCRDFDDVQRRMGQRSISEYRPFTLAVTLPGTHPMNAAARSRQWIWNGSQLLAAGVIQPPIASSGHCPETIQESRRQLYSSMLGSGASLHAFHRSHRPSRGPVSPCMHRPEASTVSLTYIVVDAEQVSMAYADGPPCRTPLAEPVAMERRIVEASADG